MGQKILLNVLLVFCAIALNGCSAFINRVNGANQSADQSPVTTSPSAAHITEYDFYTVRPHDSLQSIAKKFNVKKDVLIKSNDLRKPYKLKAGQRLKIPVPPSLVQTQQPTTQPIPLTQSAQATSDQPPPNVLLTDHSLLWPANGKVVRTFAIAGNDKGSKGIDIAGTLNQEVLAGGDGKVVYSGNSLTGYGKSIIIKHGESVVTVYALTKSVLVKEGQTVKAGEKIATMGSNARGEVVLHFEVRIDGNPQDPLLYLEKK